MSIYEKLMKIQAELKAPKDQYNEFGKYHYRNLEDIQEGLKPLLEEYKALVIIDDEIVLIGDRYYIKATATLIDAESKDGNKISVNGYAREDLQRKGMDLPQLTGATSSYARKYAMNGLFAIDDTKDSDFINTGNGNKPKSKSSKGPSENQIKRLYAIAYSVDIDAKTVKEHTKKRFNKKPEELTRAEYDAVCEGYEKLQE